MGKELLQQLLAAPEAHPEKITRQLLLHIGPDATSSHEQAGFGTKFLSRANQLVDRWPIHRLRA